MSSPVQKEGSRRATRTCAKKVVYKDNVVLSSDNESCNEYDDSDATFSIDVETKKENAKNTRKTLKNTNKEKPAKSKKKNASPKVARKRAAKKTNETVNVDDDSGIPNKKIKTEVKSESGSCDQTFDNKVNIKTELMDVGDGPVSVKNEYRFPLERSNNDFLPSTSQINYNFNNPNSNNKLNNINSNQTNYKEKGSDWTCVQCNANNFRWRNLCFRCQAVKPVVSGNTEVKESWFCENCNANNYSWRKDCFRCKFSKPTNSLINNASYNNQACDWICTNCGANNFSWRNQCFRCQSVKPISNNVPTQDTKPSFNSIDNSLYHGTGSLNCREQKFDVPPLSSNVEHQRIIKNEMIKEEQSEDLEIEIKPTKKNQIKKEIIKKEGASKKKSPKKDNLKIENDGDGLKSVTKTENYSNQDQLTKECQLISKKSNLPFNIVLNIVNLFNSEATIPFIVRYRSHLTGGLSAEEIRILKQRHESAKKLLDKSDKMKKKLEDLGYLDEALSTAIDSCVTQQELDYLYEPFKVLKTSKLVKVIDMGLSAPADNILFGRGIVHLEQFVKDDADINEIKDLIIYYVGEMMSKDSLLLEKVRDLMKTERIFLNAKQKKVTANKKAADKQPKKNRPEDIYANYYNFSTPYDRVKSYQILAINRGESESCLQVSLDVPDSFHYKISEFAKRKWYYKGAKYDLREHIFNKALDFMYSKRVCPYVKRQIRNELTKQGEKASLEVFSANLKHLLLTQPVRNVTVCAVDPGYKHGCKLAILNPQQEILSTSVLYLDNPRHFDGWDCEFVKLINDYNVDLLVVGNGKGCRDVELKISQLIDKNHLKRTMKYVVASENGISVYSCSPEASEEYPNVSPNIISAISLAKRVQDPLCELVKVEPKHLGVGMYQHDINEKKLDAVLDDVVSECVSIVGVDVNNAPLRILKRVAGLSESKAKTIIETREKKGSFINREDLKNVKGIGPKSFQQCAGFIKIVPGTLLKTKNDSKVGINYLDQTIIHPEDYSSAKKVLDMNNIQPSKIGTTECIEKLKSFMHSENLGQLASRLNIPFETLKLILDALSTPLDYDIRSTFDKPLFRNKATSINDLVVSSEVSGCVQNVTHFGAFVDLGVECNGLIYTSKLKGRDLHLGQIVKVKIDEIDTNKMRIGLSLVNVV